MIRKERFLLLLAIEAFLPKKCNLFSDGLNDTLHAVHFQHFQTLELSLELKNRTRTIKMSYGCVRSCWRTVLEHMVWNHFNDWWDFLLPQCFSSLTWPYGQRGLPFPLGEPEVFPTAPGSLHVKLNNRAHSQPCDLVTRRRNDDIFICCQLLNQSDHQASRCKDHLSKEYFKSSNVFIWQAKCLLILTHHIHLKTGLRVLLQIIHAYNDFLFDTHKLIMTTILKRQQRLRPQKKSRKLFREAESL